MVAVFTHSSICPSLLRPQSVFSAPGATLRAVSFCQQREREREGPVSATTSQLFQGLTGHGAIWSMSGDGGKATAAWWGRCKSTRDLWNQTGHSPVIPRSAKTTTFILQTWLSVQHLHQWVTCAGVSALPVSSGRKVTGGCCQTRAERSTF